MDPSRIRLEDDRFGLIGAAFRPGNRAVYAGRSGDDHVWSIGIIVGPEDDIVSSIYRFDDISFLKSLVRRTTLKEGS